MLLLRCQLVDSIFICLGDIVTVRNNNILYWSSITEYESVDGCVLFERDVDIQLDGESGFSNLDSLSVTLHIDSVCVGEHTFRDDEAELLPFTSRKRCLDFSPRIIDKHKKVARMTYGT